jgi:hypothetical protein
MFDVTGLGVVVVVRVLEAVVVIVVGVPETVVVIVLVTTRVNSPVVWVN